ncbi:hypothetical protein [Draconibacterium sp.]|uniref:hypothetical protein n=1 Tax=Draconibacterium sp. TaxID=1965318 RepID=UPI00356983C0
MKGTITKSKITGLGIILLLGLLISSCDKLNETPIENFKGTWKLEGRSMFNGIEIKIEENSGVKLIGKVVSLNDNKYVKMFVETNDTWVTGIRRTSNYEFRLTEKKIGSDLFSIYDLETTKEYKVEFIDEDTIGLGSGDSKPTESSVKYIRVKNE